MSKKIRFDKALYRIFCVEHGDKLPLFYRDWWLDAVCEDGDWDVMLYIEDPHIVAICTFFEKQKGPFSYVSMPPLTKFAGPYFVRPFSDRKKHRILSQLVAAHRSYWGFEQTIHYQTNNWLAYYWRGYQQNTRYSFVIDHIQDLDQVWSGMTADYRNNKISKAERSLSLHMDLKMDLLLRLFSAPFERQVVTMPVKDALMRRLISACDHRRCGRSLYLQNAGGQVLAAVYVVWDQHTTYLLLTDDWHAPEQRSSGAGIYLVWKAIQFASAEVGSQSFDFLGGMSENLERTRRQFGAELRPYHYIKKWRGLLWWRSYIKQ